MDGYLFKPLAMTDRKAVIDIYNYFIRKSYAAYPVEPVDYNYFDYFIQLIGDYPAYTIRSTGAKVVGFAFLHPYRMISTFRSTAEITYFILPEFTGRGLGSQALDLLIQEAGQRGIKRVLASISSLNEQSLKFHLKNGFVECGRFPEIGCKFNEPFDVVWMIKLIQD